MPTSHLPSGMCLGGLVPKSTAIREKERSVQKPLVHLFFHNARKAQLERKAVFRQPSLPKKVHCGPTNTTLLTVAKLCRMPVIGEAKTPKRGKRK